MKQRFEKSERLCSRRILDKLFKRGSTDTKTFYLFPFRVLYMSDVTHSSPLPEVVFSVSKRNFKKAVDRNLLKRRCREAYRQNKPNFADISLEERPAYIAFLYLAKEKVDYHVIEKAIQRLHKQMENSSPAPKA